MGKLSVGDLPEGSTEWCPLKCKGNGKPRFGFNKDENRYKIDGQNG